MCRYIMFNKIKLITTGKTYKTIHYFAHWRLRFQNSFYWVVKVKEFLYTPRQAQRVPLG